MRKVKRYRCRRIRLKLGLLLPCFRSCSVLYFGLVTLVGVSCSTDVLVLDDVAPTIRFSTDSLASYSLRGDVLADADSLGVPSDIAVGPKYILVEDRNVRRPFWVFDRKTGALITSAGAFGEGPGEVGSLRNLNFRHGRDQGWAFDLNSRWLHHVDVDELVQTQSLTGRAVRLDDAAGTPVSPAWIDGDSIVSMGFYGPGRLALYDADGTFHRMIGPSPPGGTSTPIHVRHQAYLATLKVSMDGRRIALANLYTDRLEIYGRGKLQALVRGPGFYEPVYDTYYGSEGNSWLALEPEETRIAYLGLSVTDELIFGLYSGTDRLGRPTKEADVIVFTWTGTPIAVLDLGGDPVEIAVSVDGRELYALFHSPIPMIVRYSVPDLS